MRLFVALDIPEEVRRALRALIAQLEPAGRGARWVRTGGMHVTLKFLGETPPEKVERIRAELDTIRSTAVEMRFRNVGFFPNPRHPRVFWAGIEASPNLAELAEDVERRLEPLGFPREKRAFHPHLTLARFKTEEGLAQLHGALARLGPFEFGATATSELHLYRSELKPSGAEYTRLASFRFSREAG